MPKILRRTEAVQSRVTTTTKLKMAKYKAKYHVTEGEIIRRALDRFLVNVAANVVKRKVKK